MKLKSLLDYDDVLPMSQEESEMFIKLMLIEMNTPTIDDASPEQQELFETFEVKVVLKRLALADVTASPALLMWIVCFSDRVAVAVMCAYAICAIAEKTGKAHVTLEDLAFAFPMGFPTKEAQKECWYGQKQEGDFAKGISDNQYDDADNWVLGAEATA